MKVAIVHDFLREFGGAERVLEVLHEIYPDAPIYTAFVDYEGLGPHAQRIRQWNIKTTWAQSIPFISQLYSPLRFLAPFFFRSLDLSDYDVIISSTNAYYAKGVRTLAGPAASLPPPDVLSRRRSLRALGGGPPLASPAAGSPRKQIHICYCHTPPRSLYGYPTAMNWKKNPIVRAYGTIINHFLRMYDFKAAQEVDYFIANSMEVQKRIKKFYRRDSVVIYPPVETRLSVLGSQLSVASRSVVGLSVRPKDRQQTNRNLKTDNRKPITEYYLYVGKLAYAKHADLAIAAANRLKIPLKIVGKGGEEARLRGLAGSTVEFLGEVSDEELHNLYAQSKALIFPAEDEDFGIVPVEAMTHGVPVVAHRSGGVVESVVEGKTGVFFDELTVRSLVNAIRYFNDLDHQSMREDCIKQVQKFSKVPFQREIETFVRRVALRVQ